MKRKYRIIERLNFEKDSTYIAQYTWKLLGIFPIWRTYIVWEYESTVPREFRCISEAEEYIREDAKLDAWSKNKTEFVVAVFQADENGVLTEMDWK